MKLIDIIRDANANLLRSKVRTFLTISAVFIGAFTLALTNGLGDGIRSYATAQLGNAVATNVLYITPKDETDAQKSKNGGLSTYNPDREKNTATANGPTGTTLLTDKDVMAIQAINGVQQVYKTYTISPEYMTTGGAKLVVSVDQYVEGIHYQLDAGRLVNNYASNEVSIPVTYIAPLGLGTHASDALGKSVTLAFRDASGKLFEQQVTVVGVQAKSLLGSSNINASTEFVKAVRTRQASAYNVANPRYIYLMARFDDTKGTSYRKDLQARLAASGYDSKTFEEQLGIVLNVINVIIIGLDFFGAIALVSASFGIINTLYISVQERTKEIGLMKALGLGKGKIFTLFSLEAVLIGFWGSLLGVLVANGVGLIVDNIATKTFLKDFDNFQLLAFPWHSKLLVIGIILVVAFLAGALPARKASQKDPIEALRYE